MCSIRGSGAAQVFDPCGVEQGATDVGLFYTQGFDTAWRTKAGPVQFFVEARVFARQLDALQDNFSVNGGFRIKRRPHHRVEIR